MHSQYMLPKFPRNRGLPTVQFLVCLGQNSLGRIYILCDLKRGSYKFYKAFVCLHLQFERVIHTQMENHFLGKFPSRNHLISKQMEFDTLSDRNQE